jgi:hypothetical protein
LILIRKSNKIKVLQTKERGQIMFKVSSKKSRAKRKEVSTYRERASVVSKSQTAGNSFSFNWVMISVFGYLAIQVVLGLGAKLFVFPFSGTDHTTFLAQGLIIIAGFYIGAFIIGVLSPGRRTVEPVMGAVLAVAAAFSVSNFTPQMGGWFRLDGIGMMGVAAMMAGTIAAFGVYSGEKLMGNVGK